MPELNIPPLLWLVAFQMLLHAAVWGLAGALLRDERAALLHWGLFMLLLGIGLALAGARGEPRQWLLYNGVNIVTVLAFALMRRGTEAFLRVPRHDGEQLALLVPVLLVIGGVGAGTEQASLRIVLAYGAEAVIMLRTVATIRPALALEFGRRTMLGIALPGAAIGVLLVLLALRQGLSWSQPLELQRSESTNLALMVVYLAGSAAFSFGFMALVTQRLTARLREASVRDALTGLYNRRAMSEALGRLWSRHHRSAAPLAVLVVDIDHFKRINDSQGHAAGDAALKRVAAMLQGHLRAEDVVGRIGGEEFLLLLPDTKAPHAHALAERLRERMHADPLGTTISIGIAMAGKDDSSAESVIARADAALYRAKDRGRDRIELAA